MRKFEQLKEKMNCNGYAYFDQKAFHGKNIDAPCYIPENSEGMEDVYSRRILIQCIDSFCAQNHEFIQKHKITKEEILTRLWERLEWQFPETLLDEWVRLID